MSRQERTTQLVRKFKVRDTFGAVHTVEEWGDFVRLLTLDGQWTNWARNGGRLALGSRHVNPTDDPKVFELPDTGERLTAVDPE